MGGMDGAGSRTSGKSKPAARREGDEWVINGEKMWAINCAGWDFKGCDLACVVCRDVTEPAGPERDPRDKVMIILVTRADLDRNGDGAFRVLRHLSTPSHTSVSGPHVKYTNVRVPAKNVLCLPGQGAQVAFASHGRRPNPAAFHAALAFGESENRGGALPLLERRAFAGFLSGIKMQTEACRALTWKAAHAMENGPGDYDARRELALSAKVYCSDAAVKACTDAINAVGPFAELLNNAIVLPIFDEGNVSIRRRHMQQLMLSATYDAWATTYGPSSK
ncbi:acyl-CoA dehydrogenase/oxidase C-terminal [Xylariaceae sp. FL1272]|nr:acyl-CoA dehydrogenase/oxidase C-terminal [Xylariaceae sp. FL1272]